MMNSDFELKTPTPPKCEVCGNELVIVDDVEMLYTIRYYFVLLSKKVIKMPSHTIEITEEQNRKIKYLKVINNFNHVQDVIGSLIDKVTIPDLKE